MPHPNDTDNEDYVSVNVPSRNSAGVYGSVIYFVSYRFKKADRHLRNISSRKHYLNIYDFIDKDGEINYHDEGALSMVEYKT
ncbi:hypothetical protein [Stenotrophomonas phage RAS14]